MVARLREGQAVRIVLSVPELSEARDMLAVERALEEVAGVRAARVNLTRRRAEIEAGTGVSPEALCAALAVAGYAARELDPGALEPAGPDPGGRDLLMRLGVAGFAAMNVMLLSISVWSGAEGATRDMFHWISALIALPAAAFAGQPFYRSALAALRRGQLNMDVPITLAIVLTLATSVYETAQSGAQAYFDATLMLCFFLLAGRYLDHRTRSAARSAAQELAALEVPRATRLRDGQEETVAQADLAAGDLIRVWPGSRIPVDGVVTEGISELDRSLLTGESQPVAAGPGLAVQAGEVNLVGPLVLRATAVGRDTSLHALTDLVAVAESGRSQYSSLADRAARLYAPGVHLLAALAAVGWLAGTGDLRLALNIAAAVLIITCPCALALAVPAVTTAASGRLFRRGVLIKDATALERLAETDIVVFDKTGTLTLSEPEVQGFAELPQRMQALAAGVTAVSAHPMARAIARAAQAAGAVPAPLEAVREVPGFGIEARWEGQRLRIGRPDWTGGAGPVQPGGSAVWMRLGEGEAVAITLRDRLRPGARDTVEKLRAQGMRICLLSGDRAPAVAALAWSLGIEDWRAAVLPQDKAAHIRLLSAQGGKVLMVGDGLNDTAALAAAHVSISPATGLEAARAASDMVLLQADLSAIPAARQTAISAVRRIRGNFRIATVYNILAVPLAVAGLCSPLIAAAAMSLSSVTVSLNALRLR
ncbi:cadmium-translocating P-type ATPase [Mangrovicoccus sp. HB182678]|uniref:Cadmium-translocating P-type ATPase n=2 Tax=Mangrovicoccus algicola TaxID=2771008 RepID=A0A8J7CZ86_9RHOB|nr:heavy metal translocating P-type ATPase [Mangrovicoccus algicola]MBE3637513.1 cadmium-translocating P-type ATPase [Mangrovicoccus algicola]